LALKSLKTAKAEIKEKIHLNQKYGLLFKISSNILIRKTPKN